MARQHFSPDGNFPLENQPTSLPKYITVKVPSELGVVVIGISKILCAKLLDLVKGFLAGHHVVYGPTNFLSI